ncbi:DUF4296 domain-containing protein [Bizionia arctica]|uniref:Lipoprotein n=1 Tax=Bizionia arctica TaxID=1495645 RepID=A0A917GD66_9FLAO|nr:DUF4296 domain-containing protein [Bizionia arctica]GGG39378.1 lipoprotein precursor [Bizionia arctica]
MRKILTVITLFAFLIACSNSAKIKKPKNLIPKEQMADILIDVALINSAKGINKSVIEKNGIIPDAYIYKKHNIDSLQFVLSNEYYTYNIKVYQEIILKVDDSLKNLRIKYETLADRDHDELMILDSIKKSKRKVKELLKEPLKENPIPPKDLKKN